jgi:glucose-6-phosphate 3-dehydrogenase
MKIGIAGCGGVSVAHIKALQKINGVSIYAFYSDTSKLKKHSEQVISVIRTETFEKMVSSVDGVIIATPNNTHFDIFKKITSIKSIPVLCEKPLTSSLEDAKEFVKLAHPSSAINFNYRFNPVVSLILKAKEKYGLGGFIFIDLAFNKNSALTKKNLSWRDQPNQNKSSGAFGDLGSHLFDLVNYFSRSSIRKDSLNIAIGTRVKTHVGITLTADDHCVATGITDKNIPFKIRASKTSPESDLGFHIHLFFQHGEIEYSTARPDHLTISHADNLDHDVVKIDLSKLIPDPQAEIPYWSDSFYFQHMAWINQIMGTANNSVATVQDGLRIQELLLE